MDDKDIFLKGLAQIYNGIGSQSTWVGSSWSPENISAEQLLTMNKLFLDMIAEARVTLGYYYNREDSEKPYSYGEAKAEIQSYKTAKSFNAPKTISDIKETKNINESQEAKESADTKEHGQRKEPRPGRISIGQ
ncbi:hypothetical protein GOM49_03400 [Clostridium bovifaecis]|uniref:Uncharacterized protein n=1 Tax=Clostridium bovifaecis TaxID=2184719 RepID=A0A6I6F1K7_9CLOT|nr:hypothetical protein GOM49_03400 [Clostridium bovifaecis]